MCLGNNLCDNMHNAAQDVAAFCASTQSASHFPAACDRAVQGWTCHCRAHLTAAGQESWHSLNGCARL